MKRFLSVLFIFLIVSNGVAQRKDISSLNLDGTLKKKYGSFPKGTPVQVLSVTNIKNKMDLNGFYLAVSIDNKQMAFPSKDAKYIEFYPQTTEQFWMAEFIKADMFGYYSNKNYKRALRKELTEETDDYLNSLENTFYADDYLQDYIHTIFTGIAPRNLVYDHLKQAEIQIIQSPNPDAYMLPNGVLLITTGLLTTLDSVEELTALIVNELAHFVFDHSLSNIVKETNRVRRAQFWSGVLLVAAGITEVVLTESHEDYIPGGILLTTGLTGAIISDAAINRLGMGYTDKQVRKVDQFTVEFLEKAGMNKEALSSALQKIRKYYLEEKDIYAFSKAGGYANIDERIEQLGPVNDSNFSNREFQKKMAVLNTVNGMIQLNSKNYESAKRFVKKNIDKKLASDDDYVVFIKADMKLTNSPDDNERNLILVRKAKQECLIPNLTLYKQEILLLMRLERENETSIILKEYIDILNDYLKDSKETKEVQWTMSEINWANKLYRQINLF